MPICTSCTHPVPYLYTVYQSAYNLRLEQCPACHAFADPYVEHDTLTLLLDLILLKRDVYRHLLYNRGLGARRVGPGGGPTTSAGIEGGALAHPGQFPPVREGGGTSEQGTEKARWWLIARLGLALIAMDAFIRWTHLSVSVPSSLDPNLVSWNRQAAETFFRIFAGCFVETITFHAGIVAACYVVMDCLDWFRSLKPPANTHASGIRLEFRYSHVPLTLLYSSLTKLFLLFLLSVWHPASPNHNHVAESTFTHPIIVRLLSLLDEERLDREWVVRNVLGGMAAGFGLRVVLDCHPLFTTAIILAGWSVKTLVAMLVGDWVKHGLDEGGKIKEEMWLAYSIP
ncbi:Arv1-domain-containing protein [Laetiporus sulphureus 93-53]|uniref:Protein ARV n=1 Tax=Laetiporus sulphureus 93-53 TaxID=1314785 RepID=A0A165ERI1_9APHY|nr:Arv1-domain-containing protein [Laetiporus sulphureus 93-53]KZT07616.1 Arv1-domain-containing protein [Laetiporus sulphureus 93-53]